MNAGNRRGFVFSLDAAIAAGLLLILALFLGSFVFTNATPELASQRLTTVSRDLLLALDTPAIGQLQDDSVVIKDLMAAGILTNADVSKTALDVIGDLWANGNVTLAQNITANILDLLLANTSYNVQIIMNGTQLYARNYSNKTSYLIRQRAVVSGIATGLPTYGFVARAWAIKASKNNTLTVMGDVVSSSVKKTPNGNNNNEVNITYRVDLPPDSNVSNATAFIETQFTDNPFKVYINGAFIYQSSGQDLREITPYIHPGNNTIDVVGE